LPDGNLGRLLRRLQPDVVEVGSHYFLPDMVLRALASVGPRRPALAGFFHTAFPGSWSSPSPGACCRRESIAQR